MRANRSIGSLSPVCRHNVREFLAKANKAGIPIFITESRRSAARQAYLFASGRAEGRKHQPIVTNADGVKKLSNHQRGLAVDIAFRGAQLYPPRSDPRWRKLGFLAWEMGLFWGGFWKHFPDFPHFQYEQRAPFNVRRGQRQYAKSLQKLKKMRTMLGEKRYQKAKRALFKRHWGG